MEFKFPATNGPRQQIPMYGKQSSPSASDYTYFTEHATGELPRGRFIGSEVFRESQDTMEAIQLEIKKEEIRERMIAEEIARFRRLEANMWRVSPPEGEMMAMRHGGALSPAFMEHHNRFDPGMRFSQPIGMEERIIMALDEKSRRADRRREIGS